MLLGIDICSTHQLKRALERSPQLGEELFSSGERDYSAKARSPEVHLAGRWAAKEACLKAFGLSTLGYELYKLEVVHEPSGRPQLHVGCDSLRADMRRVADRDDFDLQLSISHERDHAVACVVVTP